jgi:hypothetical protein
MAMNAASIHAHFTAPLPQLALTRLQTDHLNGWNGAMAKTDGLVLAAATVLDRIAQERSLSDDGKQTKYAEEGTRILPSFAYLGKQQQGTCEIIDRHTHLMVDPITAKPKDANDLITYQREAEIRRAVGKANATAAFIQSLETDDLETARALLDAPGGSWVPADIRHRGEETYAKRTQPDIYAERQSLTLLADQLGAMAAMVADWLVGLGVDPKAVAATVQPPTA